MPRLWLERVLTSGHDLVADVVSRVLEVEEGGEPYFELLDSYLRTPEIISAVRDEAINRFGSRVGFITTGQFGEVYEALKREWQWTEPVIVIRGSLRHEPRRPYIEPWKLFGVSDWVLLDDSLYMGRTLMKVRDAVSMAFRPLAGAVVAYDGSYVSFVNTYSLFRYRDEYKKGRDV